MTNAILCHNNKLTLSATPLGIVNNNHCSDISRHASDPAPTAKMKPYIAVPIVVALVHRAWSRKSLTPLGIIVAALTAIAHAIHPWSAPLTLLVVFYLGGTKVTKVRTIHSSTRHTVHPPGQT